MDPDTSSRASFEADLVKDVISLLDASVSPIPSSWVPSVPEIERRQLAALGSALSATFGPLPEASQEVQGWLAGTIAPAGELQTGLLNIFDLGPEAIAALYNGIVKASQRRALGTFFTPNAIVAKMLADWELQFGAPTAVIDVGAGVGAFTMAAANAWPESVIVAIDINPVTLGLLQLLEKVRGSKFGNVRFRLKDFALWMNDDWSNISGPRLILGNPPYTRWQLLDRGYRSNLVSTNSLVSSRASLSTIFTAIGIDALGEQDGLSLVLPAQWLESDYALDLRNRLWQERRRQVTLVLADDWAFDDAMVDAVLLEVGPRQPQQQRFMMSMWSRRQTGAVERTKEPPTAWRHMFTQSQPVNNNIGDRLSAFSKLQRGTATGANSFFVITEATAKAWVLPSKTLRPLFRRFSEAGRTSFLFSATVEDRSRFPTVDAYITYGESRNFHDRELCKRRNVWFDLSNEIRVPDVIVGPMSRGDFVAFENTSELSIVNNLYGWTWTVPNIETRQSVMDWFRSDAGQSNLRSAARHQATGLMKLEPRALREVRTSVTL